jgi:hypothetical protein
MMVEAGVDHGVGRSRAAAQAIEIFKRAAMNFGTCRGKRGCSRIRAGQAEHLMTCSEEFLNDRRAEPSSGASD